MSKAQLALDAINSLGSKTATAIARVTREFGAHNTAAAAAALAAEGGGSQPGAVVLAVRDFTETAGAGVYTATVDLPANTRLMRIFWNTAAGWGDGSSGDADLDISDENGSLFSDQVEQAPDPLTIIYKPEDDSWASLASSPKPETGKLYASGQTITCTITSGAATGTGIGLFAVKYAADPDTAAAVKS